MNAKIQYLQKRKASIQTAANQLDLNLLHNFSSSSHTHSNVARAKLLSRFLENMPLSEEEIEELYDYLDFCMGSDMSFSRDESLFKFLVDHELNFIKLLRLRLRIEYAGFDCVFEPQRRYHYQALKDKFLIYAALYLNERCLSVNGQEHTNELWVCELFDKRPKASFKYNYYGDSQEWHERSIRKLMRYARKAGIKRLGFDKGLVRDLGLDDYLFSLGFVRHFFGMSKLL